MAVINSTIGNLANTISGIVDDWVLEEKQKTGKSLVRKLAVRTPYRTGQAKINWVASNDNPGTNFQRVPENAPLGIAFAETQSVKKADAILAASKPYKLTYIQNNAPYIARLNNGYSLQAPALFVDSAIIEAVNEV